MKKYHYTYYSYEEFGRGYIGKRSCNCLPAEDVKYFGSYKDKTFKPTQKIILETYDTEKESARAEKILHNFYDVRNNFHFANQVNAGEKFYRTPEQARNDRKRYWDSLTEEERIQVVKRMHSNKKSNSERLRQMNMNRTPEQKKEIGKKISQKRKEYWERLPEDEKIKAVEKMNSGKQKKSKIPKPKKIKPPKSNKVQKSKTQKSKKVQKSRKNDIWKCTVTGYISSACSVTYYQKSLGIDKSNRIKIN
jgi:hypothetical protein